MQDGKVNVTKLNREFGLKRGAYIACFTLNLNRFSHF